MPMPETENSSGLGRRRLLRGGTLALGAAGATVAMSALNAGQARAADGDALTIGSSNTGQSTTGLTLDSGTEATLQLANPSGASLHLAPTTAVPADFAVGDVINRTDGPAVVVDYGNGAELTYLATAIDVPMTLAFSPERIMDTRSSTFRAEIVDASSSSWADSSKRVKAGAWIDIAVLPVDFAPFLDAVYVNLTAVGAANRGSMVAWTPGDPKPAAANLQFPKTYASANLAIVAPAPIDGLWCIRVQVNTAACHVVADVSGLTGYFPPSPDVAAAKAKVAAAGPVARAVRTAQARTRTVRSVKTVN